MSYGGDRPTHGRSAAKKSRNRLIAVAATLAVFGGVVAVTQVSNAGTRRPKPSTPAAVCFPATQSPAPTISPGMPSPGTTAGTFTGHFGARHHIGDGQWVDQQTLKRRANPDTCTPAPPNTGAGNGQGGDGGLQALGNSCENSKRPPHDGFQEGDRCVSTAFGEVGSAERNPTLLITSSPLRVRVNQPFTIRVSTRNLVRDRFLPAAQGGYYKESSFLDENGLTRGHFHTACRMLQSTRVAPAPDPAPEFFVATEDGRGGARPDEVAIQVPGLPRPGIAQCAVWAGDGSHRVPMMQRANQIPAFDVVRIVVTR